MKGTKAPIDNLILENMNRAFFLVIFDRIRFSSIKLNSHKEKYFNVFDFRNFN